MMSKLLGTLGLVSALSFVGTQTLAETHKKNPSLASLVKVNDSSLQFEGLTIEGVAKLKEVRDSLRRRFRIFDNRFLNLGTVHHAATLARLYKGNMFLYGPPGSGKSALVKWILKGEKDPAFQMQLHQMITEQAFTGGQNFEKAKLGQFEINTKGSLADYAVALLDEAEKGNPAALSSLLSLLEEREIMAGNTIVKAKTETIFATSNANLPEIFDQFTLNGLGTTAPAFLNRFIFKVFAYNWLDDAQRQELLGREKERQRLTALASVHEKAQKNEVFLDAEAIDWDALRFLSTMLVKTNKLFDLSYNELLGKMREVTHDAIESSERNVKDRKEAFVYFPSCDYNTRNLLRIPSVIQLSAFVDFLLSDAADDLNIVSQKPIELGVLSLWRAYLVMTTIGPGTTKLTLNAEGTSYDVDFGWNIDASKARDERERGLIRNLVEEQKRFRDVLQAKFAELQKHIKLASGSSIGVSHSVDDDFEHLIMKK